MSRRSVTFRPDLTVPDPEAPDKNIVTTHDGRRVSIQRFDPDMIQEPFKRIKSGWSRPPPSVPIPEVFPGMWVSTVVAQTPQLVGK